MKEKIKQIIDQHFLMLEDPHEKNEMKIKMLQQIPEFLAADLYSFMEKYRFSSEELYILYRRIPLTTYLGDPKSTEVHDLLLKIHSMLKEE